jgi:hypothetical protein
MPDMKYRPRPKKNVNAEQNWSVGVMIVLLLLTWIVMWVPLMIYVAMKWKKPSPRTVAQSSNS